MLKKSMGRREGLTDCGKTCYLKKRTSGAKAPFQTERCGTAEAVPLSKTDFPQPVKPRCSDSS